jgi:hypothetical protein
MPRLAAKARAVTLRQLLDELEAGVVARARVLGAWITEPEYQLVWLTGLVGLALG